MVPLCVSSQIRRGDHTASCTIANEEGQAFYQDGSAAVHTKQLSETVNGLLPHTKTTNLTTIIR